MTCHRSGFAPISIIGFGFDSVSSLSRVPRPPARITAFTWAERRVGMRSWARRHVTDLVCDLPRDRERRGGGGRRRVAHVQRASRAGEDEVVDQAAVAAERLRAYARGAVEQGGGPQLGDELRRRPH